MAHSFARLYGTQRLPVPTRARSSSGRLIASVAVAAVTCVSAFEDAVRRLTRRRRRCAEVDANEYNETRSLRRRLDLIECVSDSALSAHYRLFVFRDAEGIADAGCADGSWAMLRLNALHRPITWRATDEARACIRNTESLRSCRLAPPCCCSRVLSCTQVLHRPRIRNRTAWSWYQPEMARWTRCSNQHRSSKHCALRPP